MDKVSKKLKIAEKIITPFMERLKRDKIDWTPKKKKRPKFRLKDAMRLACDRVVSEIRNLSKPGYLGGNVARKSTKRRINE